MINLDKLRLEYTQMPLPCLEKLANEDYAIDVKTINASNRKSLIDMMISIEFKNYYK